MNATLYVKTVITIVAFLILAGCGLDIDGLDDLFPEGQPCGDKMEMAQRDLDLGDSEKAAWHKSNLYDAATDSYYLPQALFYTTTWNGEKQFSVPDVDFYSGYEFCTRLTGPVEWTHPWTGDQVSIYRESYSSYSNYWFAGEHGIERMYSAWDDTFYSGALYYPSGAGWRIEEPVTSTFYTWREGILSESTQTIEVEEVLFDHEGIMAWIVVRRSVDGKLDREYMLEPKRGVTRVYVFDEEAYDGSEEGYDCGDKSTMAGVSYALSDIERAVWSRENLYDGETDSYYIPPELWTGAVWEGGRELILHPADLYFGSLFCKHITGPTDWVHPINNAVYQIYTRTNKDKVQYFVMTPNGLGRVYDSRRGGTYYEDEVKFPAGAGWKIGEIKSLPYRHWRDGVVKDKIRRIEITDILFDEDDVLAALRYRYYAGDMGDVLDHEYMYMPRRGMVHVQKYSDF